MDSPLPSEQTPSEEPSPSSPPEEPKTSSARHYLRLVTNVVWLGCMPIAMSHVGKRLFNFYNELETTPNHFTGFFMSIPQWMPFLVCYGLAFLLIALEFMPIDNEDKEMVSTVTLFGLFLMSGFFIYAIVYPILEVINQL